MKKRIIIQKFAILSNLVLFGALLFTACGTSKKITVDDSWKAKEGVIDKFKTKNVLVLARTSDDNSRIAFEEEIAKQLRAQGVQCTESFYKVPKIHPNTQMTEERLQLIKNLMDSEGYTGVVITSIKDKDKTTTSSDLGVRVGFYGNFYPDYYGSFYDYYTYPYANGPYYSGFEGYVPVRTTTRTETTYVLETVAYNLDEAPEEQLVAVVTSRIKDPKKASETASDYVAEIIKAWQEQ